MTEMFLRCRLYSYSTLTSRTGSCSSAALSFWFALIALDIGAATETVRVVAADAAEAAAGAAAAAACAKIDGRSVRADAGEGAACVGH